MMDRLTKRLPNGKVKCAKQTGEGVMPLLAAYEDTNLTPSEIAAIQADIDAGRLQRFPEFPQDMNDILEPLKIQSALNSEVMKLNFRKEHKPKDVSILDYTIIAALHKALTEAARAALGEEADHV